jgi:DNA helicase-2/ATP-dependent DNA helicase PcrA
MDFSDLLLNTKLLLFNHHHVREFLQDSLEHILVDEFQDTNPIQYEIVTQLSGSKRNIMVVGDDDQAIYAFRGATVKNMFRFKKDFPEAPVVALEQNYRSTAIILESAHSVVEKNVNRTKKKLWTDGPKGHPIKLYIARDEGDEAAYIAAEIKRICKSRSLRDIAIFYRTNAQSRALEEALIAMGIAYQIFGGLRFYDRKEVRDILGYLRLIVNHSDTEAFLRVIGNPPRGIGAKTIESIDKLRGSGTFLDGARLLAKQNAKVASFIEQIDSLIASSRKCEPAALIGLIVEQTGYAERLKQEGEEGRLENLEELAALARTVELEDSGRTPQELLYRFLDRISLSGSDEVQNVSTNGSVSLMTLHLAKGLEFPVVFFSGLEDGLLPHVRTFDKDDELAEERRLCYVGITRAMESLYLTRACWRASRNGPDCRMESRFLQDIPSHCIELDPTSYGDINDEKYSSNSEDVREQIPSYSRGKSFRNDTFSLRSRRVGGSYSADIPIIRSADDLRMKDSKSGLKANLASMPILPVADATALREGVRVRHPMFGDGTVLETEGVEEVTSLKITVVFDRTGETKRLAYQHARLAVIQ